jgi:hypothetical protein
LLKNIVTSCKRARERSAQADLDHRNQWIALERVAYLLKSEGRRRPSGSGDVDEEIQKSARPVTPIRIFIPTEESKPRDRDDINREAYIK